MNIRSISWGLLIFSISLASCNTDGNKENKNALYENTEGDTTGSISSQTNETISSATTQISFDETEHDFGIIDEGIMASHTFKFKNTGTIPLVISDARADCGCTVPSWTKEPVLPGDEGQIEVKYNSAGRSGQTVNKTVTVIANTDPSDNKLIIKAQVKDKNAGSPVKK